MALHMWCRIVTWRDKYWWIQRSHFAAFVIVMFSSLAAYFIWISPLIPSGYIQIVIGTITSLISAVVFILGTIYYCTFLPHRDEGEEEDFKTLSEALFWYFKVWICCEWFTNETRIEPCLK